MRELLRSPADGAEGEANPSGAAGASPVPSASPAAGSEARGSEAPPEAPPEGEGVGGASPAPSGDEPGAKPQAGGEPKAPASPPPDWREKRLAKQAAKMAEMAARLAEFENKRAEGEPVPQAPAGFTQADVEARARQLAAEQEFNKACTEAEKAGRSLYTDFDSRIAQLAQVMDRSDPRSVGAYTNMVAAALKTGEGPSLLYALSSDMNEAERLMELSPVDQALALAKMARDAGKGVSSAPKPATPVGTRGGSADFIKASDPTRADKLSTREWIERREAELAERRKVRA